LPASPLRNLGTLVLRNRWQVELFPLGELIAASRRLLVELPDAVGGILIFEPKNAGTLKFD
jgi:hypothetical protein